MKTMQKTGMFLCVYLISGACFCQTFYYSGNQQITITENKSSAIFFYQQMDTAVLFDDPDTLVSTVEYTGDSLGFIVHLNAGWTSDIADLRDYLGLNANDLNGSSFSFSFEDGTKIFPSFQVVIRIADGYTPEDIDSLLNAHQLTFTDTLDGIAYALGEDAVATMDAANAIHTNEMISWCHPDFLVKAIPAATYPTDAFFLNQYYLNNTGQNGGTADADIDAPEAWDLTTGNNTIRVAVVDEGINQHPDIVYANGNSRVLSGWSYDGNVSSIPPGLQGSAVTLNEKHGMYLAGIIGASQGFASNSCGVSGVCPACLIIPVRRPSTFVLSSTFAAAINWAWNNNSGYGQADIINCSWNIGGNGFPNITLAINQALSLGRNNKGSVVVFSAGNWQSGQSTAIAYPANVPGVICVSALDKNGAITSYSRYGPEVVVSAFGGDPVDIYTTAHSGNGNAYSCGSNDYFNAMGGTSAAAAEVSGLAALLLSVDPNLTSSQCSCRIANTATDMGSIGFDNFYGHGIADAYYSIALSTLQLIDEQISGLQQYASTDFIIVPAYSNLLAINGCRINSGANVSLTTSRAVILNPGFDAAYGSVLSATINTTTPCGVNNGGPFRLNPQEADSLKNNFNPEISIKVSPNPAQAGILISTSGENVFFSKLKIKSVVGRELHSICSVNHKSYYINTASLPAGLYIVEAETNGGVEYTKFIKQ